MGIKEILENLGIKVYRSGENLLQIRCIYHNEKKASLTLYLNSGRFYCFGCGKWGKIENLMSYLLKENKDISQKELNFNFVNIQKKMDYSDIYTKFINFLWDYNQKKKDDEVLNYLKNERLLEEDIINYFRVCYIPHHYKQYKEVKNFLLNNWDIKELQKAALLDSHNRIRFLFHRVIIPIRKDYKVIGLWGRYFHKGKADVKIGRYKGTMLKEKVLFNEDDLKEIKKGDKVILVEGLFDTMIVYQESLKRGYKGGVVGLISSNFWNEKTIKKLKDFELYLWLDNDKTGKETEKKIMKIFNQLNGFDEKKAKDYWNKHKVRYPEFEEGGKKFSPKDQTEYYRYLLKRGENG